SPTRRSSDLGLGHERLVIGQVPPLFIYKNVIGERGARRGAIVKKPLDFPVKPRHNQIVAVKQMNPFSLGTVQTGFEIAKASAIGGVLKITYSSSAQPVNQARYVSIQAVVIHHLDLHAIGPRILNQDRKT